MTTYSYSQLEQLWINAGGSTSLAPLAAGIAIVESGGNPAAYNSSSASGLWQLISSNQHLVPGGSANVFNAQDNAAGAVALSGNTLAGLTSNWLAYEPPGAAEAIVKQNGGTLPSGTLPAAGNTAGVATGSTNLSSGSSSTSSSGTPSTSSSATGSSSPGTASILSQAAGLLNDVAVVLDYFFGMFGKGQGWRLIFLIVAIVAAGWSYKAMGGPNPLRNTMVVV